MHVPDGVLTTEAMVITNAVACIATGYSLRKVENDAIPRVGVLSAVFFVSSLIHINIGPSSVHLLLNGLVGVVLGWASFPAIAVALILQAAFFGFGGITALGANTLHVALGAALCGLFFRRKIQSSTNPKVLLSFGFLSGFLGVVFTSILLGTNLYFNNYGKETLYVLIMAHLPLAFIEGVIAAATISYIKKLKPEIFKDIR